MQNYIFITVVLTLLFSCDTLNPREREAQIADNMMLLSTVFGQGQGIWIYNPATLEVHDTLSTGGSWSVNLSPDHKILYTAWWDSEAQKSKVYAIDMETKTIIREQEILNPNVHLDHTKHRLISMGGNPGIQVLDAHTFDILNEGYAHLRNLTAKAVASPIKNELYALVHEEGKPGVAGIIVYNTESFQISDIIPLTADESRRRSMRDSYIAISPDGRFVYATVFNWQGGGGYGSFHVVDLEKGKQVFESVCGGFAWIGVSPVGRYVYLSDSAGTPFSAGGVSHEFVPTNEILRYDVERRRVEIFANGGRDLGLSGTDLLITSSIAVAQDGRSMFIRVLFGGTTREGLNPDILHVDTRTKEHINAYYLRPDPDGFTRSLIHHLQLEYMTN